MTETAVLYATPPPGLMSVLGRCGFMYDLMAHKSGSLPASAAFSAANRCYYFPFQIEQPDIINKFWWANGATVGTDTIQCAVYRDDYTQLLLGASVTSAGANDVQFDDVTNTLIVPGRYYFALSCSGTTATFLRTAPATLSWTISVGVYQQATAKPPPNPMVPVQITNGYIPLCGIQFRTSA